MHKPIYVALNPHCSISIEQSMIKDTNMDGQGTPAKKARKSPTIWTSQYKMVLERIINKDNGGQFKDKLKNKSKETQQQAWTDIIAHFRIAFGMMEVDRKSLQSLWQRMKGSEKGIHDRDLLNLYKATHTTGGGPGPNPVYLDDPDKIDEEPGMGTQSGSSGMQMTQNSPLITRWNQTHRVRDSPHTVTSSTVQSDQVLDLTLPVVNSGGDILIEASALTDVNAGEQEVKGDDLDQSQPDPVTHADAPTIGIGNNDSNPAVHPNPTLTETPARAPKRPSAAAKATAYVDAAESTKRYWTEKLEFERDIYKAQMELLANKIENEKKSRELFDLQIQKARQELDHQ